MNTNRIWLILEKSDETRVSKSINSYKDRTGEVYNYDSLVPNYKNLKVNDFVILRKENDILGMGKINSIKSFITQKPHKRCPFCNATDIRLRSNKTPKWKCGICKAEFSNSIETESQVTAYTADIIEFNKFDLSPTVKEIKSCAIKGEGLKSQLSIMELDFDKIKNLLLIEEGGISNAETKSFSGQGINLTHKERKAVELRAMKLVADLYTSEGWILTDTSNSRPYDFKATRGSDNRFIEVKGTTGEGISIILTNGEVKQAKDNPRSSVLVIVSRINLDRTTDSPIASGGVISLHLNPWILDDDKLTPTQFRYQLS